MKPFPEMPLSWWVKNAGMFCHFCKHSEVIASFPWLPYRLVISPKT